MRRTLPVLLALSIALGLVVVAATAGDRANPQSQAVLRVSGAPAEVVRATPRVGDPSGAILAEMTRVQGTPGRVSREARKHARQFALQRARIRAREREAARRRAAAEAARRAAAQPSFWNDPQAATVARSLPSSPAENAWLQAGHGGWVESNGMARAPANAPDAIKRVIAAGNQIARSPYLWGGGHGAWRDKGYDCSGSVSYALAAGGMLGSTQTSGQLANWGAPGRGKWLTIYANDGHVFMYVAGMRFDTSGRAGDHSSRWQLGSRSADGFVARHYPGL